MVLVLPSATNACAIKSSRVSSFATSRALRSRPQRNAAKSASLAIRCEGFTTQVKRNENIGKLAAGYLFPEINRIKGEHLAKNPDADIISLGIGDTTEPIPDVISKAMSEASLGLSTPEGYSGYGAEAGQMPLREKLAETFYPGMVEGTQIFVSDGSKCDISRLQMMFGNSVTVAVQDPSYPAYVDTSVMMGMTGEFDASMTQYKNITYMPCLPENNFFPDLANTPRTDVVFFCSPNNPTGASATKSQLEELVAFCKKNGSILVYDAAYSIYIENEDCPKTIYEIEGAKEVAIETASFSKMAGFTGVRLGWTVVPAELKYSDGWPVFNDFNRVMGTCFNGASNVVQAGGLACLSDEGMAAMYELVAFYKENATMLKKCFDDLGFKTYGGVDAPYVWVSFEGRPSWECFTEILEKTDIVTTPGVGFGPAGDGFVRVSAFGRRANVITAIERFQKAFAK